MAKQPLFITGNQNKADYLARILGVPLEHRSLELDEIQSADPKEVVIHKVKQAYEIAQVPVLVEDTSLCFNALDGLPGPFVKFFRVAKNGPEMMCRMLDGFDDRSAYATAIYAYYDGKELRIFQGHLNGVISQHPRGDGGYGWDPIFEPEGYGGKTRAELSPEEDDESYVKIRDYEGLRTFLLQ
jgi:non-canonical purine NTP pyrophosphatase (RdgB/HAM1 family)